MDEPVRAWALGLENWVKEWDESTDRRSPERRSKSVFESAESPMKRTGTPLNNTTFAYDFFAQIGKYLNHLL